MSRDTERALEAHGAMTLMMARVFFACADSELRAARDAGTATPSLISYHEFCETRVRTLRAAAERELDVFDAADRAEWAFWEREAM